MVPERRPGFGTPLRIWFRSGAPGAGAALRYRWSAAPLLMEHRPARCPVAALRCGAPKSDHRPFRNDASSGSPPGRAHGGGLPRRGAGPTGTSPGEGATTKNRVQRPPRTQDSPKTLNRSAMVRTLPNIIPIRIIRNTAGRPWPRPIIRRLLCIS